MLLQFLYAFAFIDAILSVYVMLEYFLETRNLNQPWRFSLKVWNELEKLRMYFCETLYLFQKLNVLVYGNLRLVSGVLLDKFVQHIYVFQSKCISILSCPHIWIVCCAWDNLRYSQCFLSLWLFCSLAHLYSRFSVVLLPLFLSPFLPCTHIFFCDSFFQFSLVLLLPSLSLSLPFPPLSFFFFSLSPDPLLSPSERLRIPKGADAIKMLILSVYRERERGGWQHEGLRLTWRTRLKWRTGGGDGGAQRESVCVCMCRKGALKGRGGRGCVLGETEWKRGC